MWATPRVGSVYYQGYAGGQAESISEVLRLDASVVVPAGRYEGCLQIAITTPRAPEALTHRYYCPGIGHLLTVDVAGGGTRTELVATTPP